MCNDIMGNKKEMVLPTHNDDEERYLPGEDRDY